MTAMKVMVLFNPISGRGRSAASAQDVEAALTSTGHTAVCTPTRIEPTSSWLDDALRDVELAVIVGGDGAVRMAGAVAMRTQTPIYHFPCGTENLFAREFHMSRDPALLIRAIDRNQIRRVDVGTVNGHVFLLMLSIGFDAEVVHDLASTRGKSISHWTYLRPIMRQLVHWSPQPMHITVDDQVINDGRPGFVVVANSRQYGWRLNPAGRASMDDGLLDVVFFPTRGRLGLFQWAVRCRTRKHLRHPALVYVSGREVVIASDRRQHFQLDGDPPEPQATGSSKIADWQLNVGICPAALSVLVP